MVGSRAEKHHSSRVGKNWVMIGFCRRQRRNPMLHGAAALVPATATVAFTDAKAPHCDCQGTLSRLSTSLMVRLTRPRNNDNLSPYPQPCRGCCALGWLLCYPPCTCLQSPYIEVLHGLGDIELVHSGDDDGRRGEKEEKDEEDHIDHKAADPPYKAPDGEVFPGRERGHQDGCTGQNTRCGASHAHHSPAW